MAEALEPTAPHAGSGRADARAAGGSGPLGRAGLIMALGAIALGLWSLYSLAIRASRGGSSNPLYSTRRFDPHGAAALFRLLAERLDHVGTLERPWLDASASGTLVQILGSGDARPEETEDKTVGLPAASLLAWVAAGNTIIQLTRAHTELMDEAGVPRSDGPEPGFLEQIERIDEHQATGGDPAKTPGRLVEAIWHGGADLPPVHLPPLTLRSPRCFADAPDERWHVLARVDGRAVAGLLEHGAGRVIVIGAPTPALNAHLGEGGNLGALLAMVGDGPVLIDEWSHGIGHGGTVLEMLRRFGLVPLLLQIGLLVFVYRWSTRGRAVADAPAAPRARASREQIDTLAFLYAQSLTPAESVHRVHEEILRRWSAALRCPVADVWSRVRAGRSDAMRRAATVLNDLLAMGRRHPPLCRACGYNLSGAPGAACPECGARIAPSVRRQMAIAIADDAGTRPASRSGDTDLARLLTRAHELTEALRRA